MEIYPSAYRHGLTDDDIEHAWDNALAFYDIDTDHEPTKSLCIGPDTAGNLLESLVPPTRPRRSDSPRHALRPVFRGYLTGEDS